MPKPKPMKVKLFMDADAGIVEERVNAWLETIGAAIIIRTETAITPASGKSGEAARPSILVTIWYEPPAD
jgi:hypothetical protein